MLHIQAKQSADCGRLAKQNQAPLALTRSVLLEYLPSLPRIALCGLLLSAVSALSAADKTFATPVSTTLGSLSFHACEIGEASAKTEAECAYLSVPENPDAPDGKKLQLHISLINASARKVAADPVVFLAGGPGQGGSESYGSLAPAFRRLLEQRHVLVIDQRGTGLSEKLSCDFSAAEKTLKDLEAQNLEEDVLESEVITVLKRELQKCHESTPGDERFYTTSNAIQDIEALRVAVKAPQLNLAGFSYGTRLAQQYAKRYPSTTRSLILDGVAPNDHYLGSEHARNIENAVVAILQRCKKDKACEARFGDTVATFEALKAQLQVSKVDYSIPDPLTGKPRSVMWNTGPLALTARFSAYASEQAALLPLMLDEAKNGRPQTMLAMSAMTENNVSEAISKALEMSVMCSEDAEFLQANPADENTLLGTVLVRSIRAQCEVWPKGDRPKDFFEPLKGGIPTLLISGSNDPVTPAKFGEQVVKHLSNTLHIVVADQGHINLGRGCIPKLAAEFVDMLEPKKLATECVKKILPAPFFLDLTGSSP